MRIIGKDGKEYSDVKECLRADREYDAKIEAERVKKEKEKQEIALKIEQEKAAISKKKKELSMAIEKADEEYVLAQSVYGEARKKAEDILRKAKEEADATLQAAAKELEKASSAKVQAVAAFNKEFGPYKTVITGSKAKDDYNRMIQDMDRLFNLFWGF